MYMRAGAARTEDPVRACKPLTVEYAHAVFRAGCGGIPGPWASGAWRGGFRLIFLLFSGIHKDFRPPPGLLGASQGPARGLPPSRGLQRLPGNFGCFQQSTTLNLPSHASQGPRPPKTSFHLCYFNVWIPRPFEGPSKSFSRASQDPGLHLLSPVKGPLLAHRAFQSKNHKFREPRDLTNFGSQLTLSTVVMLPRPPCKAEKHRLRQRAAARYPCVRASPKIQVD